MIDYTLPAEIAAFLAVGALYSAIGHAGSTGYIALMTLLGVQSEELRVPVLVLNAMVAAIALVQFSRAGHFRWGLFWPFACTSVPLAYLGGRAGLSTPVLNVVLGVILLLTAARLLASAGSSAPVAARRPPLGPAMALGGGVGFLSGITGTGGGVFLGPTILLSNWADARRTAGATAALSLANSMAGIAGISVHGWDPPGSLAGWAAGAAIGGTLGATYGSRLADQRLLRFLLCGVLVIAGAKLMLT